MTTPQRKRLFTVFAALPLAVALLAIQMTPAWADDEPVAVTT